MRIGEVATRAGVSTRSLRYYEQQGLMTSIRSQGGQRHYAEDAVERVRWIQALYAAGLGSQAITELLPCVHTGFATAAMVDRLTVERARIDGQVQDLIRTRDRLDTVIATASKITRSR